MIFPYAWNGHWMATSEFRWGEAGPEVGQTLAPFFLLLVCWSLASLYSAVLLQHLQVCTQSLSKPRDISPFPFINWYQASSKGYIKSHCVLWKSFFFYWKLSFIFLIHKGTKCLLSVRPLVMFLTCLHCEIRFHFSVTSHMSAVSGCGDIHL